MRRRSKIEKNIEPGSIEFKIGQIWTLCQKNLTLYFKKGPVLIFGLLFPFFIAITWVIGRNISDISLFVGITSMAVFFTSTAISPVIMPWETREKGLERQISAPLSITVILLGIITASTIFSLLITMIVSIILGLSIGITFTSIGIFLEFFLGLILISIAGSLVGVAISALPTDMTSSIMIIINLVKFPLVFISGIFIPLSQLPGIASIIAWISPLTPFVDAITFSVGGASIFPIYIDLVILLIWVIILYAISRFAHLITFNKRFSN